MKQTTSDTSITEKEHKFLQLFIENPNSKFSTQVSMLSKLCSLYPNFNFSASYVQRRCEKFEVTQSKDTSFYELNEKYTQIARTKKISDTLADIDFSSLDIISNIDYIILKPKDPWSLAKLSHHLLNSLDFNGNIIDILTLNKSLLVFCKNKPKLQEQLKELKKLASIPS